MYVGKKDEYWDFGQGGRGAERRSGVPCHARVLGAQTGQGLEGRFIWDP